MSNKVGIVGLGYVGAASAFSLVAKSMCDEVVLIDIKTDLAIAHARDLEDALTLNNSHTKISYAQDITELASCDVIILAFRKVHFDTLPTRLAELENNIEELTKIILPLKKAGFKGFYIVATNPNDSIVYYTQKLSGLDKNRVFGSGTNLDSSRLRKMLAKDLSLNPCNIQAFMIGEHGDSQFAYFSKASIYGANFLEFYKNKLGRNLDTQSIEKAVINEGYFIYNKKGRTEYGIGSSCASLAEAVLKDKRLVFPVSSVFEDYAISYPCIIGKNGIEEVLQCKFDDTEKEKLKQTINAVKEAILSVKDKVKSYL
ncbi:L-lactate dehydrogenase [Campylobacter sp. MIT 99-7217]|uniref:lactate/malate family dehydrogenase n=1 Tax=Campylobacter sp. MIT 99-7217 TaxID=535091 RepID=UPI0011577EFC|nr:L-lactate dehydrogenase [Campylobacter sp. MIT 99-7217]TQR30995.1 L-lactate dehydrogenase [Campylobacter sp. MIT 99-7217]